MHPLTKSLDHLPLYRQQAIYQRSGVDLPRSTLAGWFGAVGAALKPLTRKLHQNLLQPLPAALGPAAGLEKYPPAATLNGNDVHNQVVIIGLYLFSYRAFHQQIYSK
ncbi:IS66 family transposase [Brenneria sp. EniD312]|uniref:IS66 family transposase n=1 Tax=Brenneria nigrifluens TaxID=55210 RepID=UPI0003087DCB